MYLPKPLYEAKPYLYLLTGILVAIAWGLNPYSVVGSAAFIIGGLFIIYLRFVFRRKARATAAIANANAATGTADVSEKVPEDQTS